MRAVLRGRRKRREPRVVATRSSRAWTSSPEPRPAAVFGITGVETPAQLSSSAGCPTAVAPAGRGQHRRGLRRSPRRADPAPIPQLIDRLLVVAEANGIPPPSCSTRPTWIPARAHRGAIPRAGYAVYPTSVKTQARESSRSADASDGASHGAWPARRGRENRACSMRVAAGPQAPHRRDQRAESAAARKPPSPP